MLPLCHYCGIVALVWAGGWQLLLEWRFLFGAEVQ